MLDLNIKKLLKPEEIAIIIVDMMDAYCNTKFPLPQYLIINENATFTYLEEVSEKIKNFINISRNYRINKYIFVRMLESREKVVKSIAIKMDLEKIPDVVDESYLGWDYFKVKPEKDDVELVKTSYDTFLSTELNKYLKINNIKSVIIVGGYASVCVDSTARSAAQLGYNTFVPADLTADPGKVGEIQDSETIKCKLYAINNVMGYMPLSEEIIEAWDNLAKD